MGKYMRKAKITGEVSLMEVSHQSSIGVRTRAKTLALQRLMNSSRPADSSSCYLQLRNRRLEKPFAAASKPNEDYNVNPIPEPSPYPTPTPKSKSPSPCPSPRIPVFWGFRFCCSGSENIISGSMGSVSSRKTCREKVDADSEALPDDGGGVEVSFGENVLEIEPRDRNLRETTPCSLIRDSENIATPGSTTRPTNSTAATNRRMQNSLHRNIPTANEMEEFFTSAEQLQQRMFEEKYNYDPVNDCPRPGRYEWEDLSS